MALNAEPIDWNALLLEFFKQAKNGRPATSLPGFAHFDGVVIIEKQGVRIRLAGGVERSRNIALAEGLVPRRTGLKSIGMAYSGDHRFVDDVPGMHPSAKLPAGTRDHLDEQAFARIVLELLLKPGGHRTCPDQRMASEFLPILRCE